MDSTNPIRLLLVDDHRVVRRGLQSFLESFADIQIVAEADSGEQAVKLVAERLPDVAVMDLMMPGGMDGIETTRQVRATSPHTQVVVLTAHTGDVRKDADPDILLAAVRAASRGQSMLDPAVAGSVLNDLVRESGIGHSLTEREVAVLKLLAHGRTNRQIADELVVGEETVKTHVGNILSKLHLAHRTQAVIYALKQGLVSLDDIDL